MRAGLPELGESGLHSWNRAHCRTPGIIPPPPSPAFLGVSNREFETKEIVHPDPIFPPAFLSEHYQTFKNIERIVHRMLTFPPSGFCSTSSITYLSIPLSFHPSIFLFDVFRSKLPGDPGTFWQSNSGSQCIQKGRLCCYVHGPRHHKVSP